MDCYGNTIIPGLDRISKLLEKLGNPHEVLKVIHVAGTNGKGSVAAYIESILINAGYVVGTYTSPVVFEAGENIKINGTCIADEEYVRLESEVSGAASAMQEAGYQRPTVFEIETAAAILYFVRNNCDMAVLEAGMGGKRDAVNVCGNVLCSILTSISMDHMQFLGNTLEEIARDKAGIIKPSCPVVFCSGGYDGASYETVREIIAGRAREEGAEFISTGSIAIKTEKVDASEPVITFDYISAYGNEYKNLEISMPGIYQPYNCAAATEAAEVLIRTGIRISERDIRDGVKKAVRRGRFDRVKDVPLTYMDGAHNPDAVLKFKESIDRYFEGYKIVYIMGVLEDKDFRKMAEIMFTGGSDVITVTPRNKRGLDGMILAKTIKEAAGADAIYAETYADAVAKAAGIYGKYASAGSKVLILIFGSLSYLGEIRKCL